MDTFSKTKIVCTIGPACNSPAVMEEMVTAGMSVARLNFSHGTLSDHELNISNIRLTSSRLKKPVAIIQDLSGPKIRIGTLSQESILLKAGNEFTLTNEVIEGEETRVSVTYPLLPSYVFVGDTVLLCDGEIELKVVRKDTTDIVCQVIVGGVLTARKGINIPTRSLPIPSLTEKDKRDLDFGIEHDVDYVALSFVKNADDVLQLKELLREKNKDIPVIAKIEKHEALDHLEDIIKAADAIMVARGDLGVEIPLEQIPLVQKRIIQIANRYCKPVITATQMLESMVNNYRPTRAEITDVANAIFDGSDAVMLSEETAKGRYPVEAVRMLSKIARETEPSVARKTDFETLRFANNPITVPDAISIATCQVAGNLHINVIITPTQTGSTARFISRHRSQHLILAATPSLKTYRRLALVWGVIPMITEPLKNTDDMMKKSIEAAREAGYISEGEKVVITGGVPVWEPGSTNLMRVC
ncbi:MAG: pyruvate kinase [Candidatus Brocadia sp.]|jgi:pyruvate kinase|uniref:Pyruvate kinase n=1 Tax=Candidatus Brocadia fulgida TaxID=380242 RepID=A0A0M2UWQ8_9BACT|nr:MAG: pyruvate kinase [Candidatus Brocadia fulgida]MCC6326681.1 pyruvate kinase [Candidatus Brocadia sp.]MCE7911904.1 pyruvate kinase [Candidatus Brocadia sp. AMX3]OQY98260.1 MAG: pyruvate kinase [Candidatus Brocadia sp. UTAMX2]MBV6519159.1 Pyruvate kinase [Candidatus Brocadia fulgida]